MGLVGEVVSVNKAIFIYFYTVGCCLVVLRFSRHKRDYILRECVIWRGFIYGECIARECIY